MTGPRIWLPWQKCISLTKCVNVDDMLVRKKANEIKCLVGYESIAFSAQTHIFTEMTGFDDTIFT